MASARPPATLTALAAVFHRPLPRAADVARLVDALGAEPDTAALADAGAVELVVGALLAFPRLSAVTGPQAVPIYERYHTSTIKLSTFSRDSVVSCSNRLLNPWQRGWDSTPMP
jgi:hypothetical protein